MLWATAEDFFLRNMKAKTSEKTTRIAPKIIESKKEISE
jgi:hypothetical protein